VSVTEVAEKAAKAGATEVASEQLRALGLCSYLLRGRRDLQSSDVASARAAEPVSWLEEERERILSFQNSSPGSGSFNSSPASGSFRNNILSFQNSSPASGSFNSSPVSWSLRNNSPASGSFKDSSSAPGFKNSSPSVLHADFERPSPPTSLQPSPVQRSPGHRRFSTGSIDLSSASLQAHEEGYATSTTPRFGRRRATSVVGPLLPPVVSTDAFETASRSLIGNAAACPPPSTFPHACPPTAPPESDSLELVLAELGVTLPKQQPPPDAPRMAPRPLHEQLNCLEAKLTRRLTHEGVEDEHDATDDADKHEATGNTPTKLRKGTGETGSQAPSSAEAQACEALWLRCTDCH